MAFRILHISDIHLGKNCRVYPGSPEHGAAALVKELVEELTTRGLLHDLRAVVASGDFGWFGLQEEFVATATLLHQLSDQTGVPLTDFVLVPGNHDIQWFRSDPRDSSRKIPNTRKAALSPYRDFLAGIKGKAASDLSLYLTDLVKFPNEKVVLIGLNSSRFESKSNAGLGYVGRTQVEEVMSTIGGDPDLLDYAKVVVLHHHLVPVVNLDLDMLLQSPGDRQFSLTLDAAEVISTLLAYNCTLVLHGHMHVPFCAVERRPAAAPGHAQCEAETEIVITAAGSFGVSSTYCSGIHYQILSFERQRLEIQSFWREFGAKLSDPKTLAVSVQGSSSRIPQAWTEAELRRRQSEEQMHESWLDGFQILDGNQDAIDELWELIRSRCNGFLASLGADELRRIFDEICSGLIGDRTGSLQRFEAHLKDRRNRVSFNEYILLLMDRLGRHSSS